MAINFKTYRRNDVDRKLKTMSIRPLDVMMTGVTGAGKSTTLNTVFTKIVAKEGNGVYPETMDIDSYSLHEGIRFWDTPGLGDGIEQDKRHSKKMIDLLYKTYNSNNRTYGFIDMAVIIIEGSNRDMGTTYKLLNDVIVPNIDPDRIFVAINQADMAMKGRHWNTEKNEPDSTLKAFLDEQALSVQNRVREATGMNIKRPVYYSAKTGYNVTNFLDFIIDNIPTEKRKIMSR
ncbi:MAG: 50S ribosome-binding GTPase [bacterium]|nr:50S ribosome-binding GTPase [bacterium]